jgi:hypothetical protein
MFTLPTAAMRLWIPARDICLVSGGGPEKIPRLDDLCLTRVRHHRGLLPLRRLEHLAKEL